MAILTTVRINTTQQMILYRGFVIQQTADGWEWASRDFTVTGTCQTVFEAVEAVEDWCNQNIQEAA